MEGDYETECSDKKEVIPCQFIDVGASIVKYAREVEKEELRKYRNNS